MIIITSCKTRKEPKWNTPKGIPSQKEFVCRTEFPKQEKESKAFYLNCASCHYPKDKSSNGPGLAGVMKRVPNREWLFNYIRNNQQVYKSGDAYAKELKQKYSGQMPVYEWLSDKEINEIIDYLEEVQ